MSLRRVRAWLWRVVGMFATTRRERELADEIESHLQLHTDEAIRRGMSPEAARRAAVLQFGSVEATKAAYRDRRGLPIVETMVHDVRYAARVLIRRPGFALTTIAILSIGIGVNTGLFTIFSRMTLRPLDVPDPQTLVRLAHVTPHGRSETFSSPDYRDLQARTRTLAAVIAFGRETIQEMTTGGSGNAEAPVRAMFVSDTYMTALGARAALGRTLAPADDHAGAVVVGDAFWRRRFDRDPAAVGSTIALNGQRLTIVGVMPRTFTGLDLAVTDVWIPLALHGRVTEDHERERLRDAAWLEVAGRLAPGVTPAQAQAELTTIAGALGDRRIEGGDRIERIDVVDAANPVRLRQGERLFAGLVVLATGLLLAIACANIAGVVLARSLSRQEEIGVRLSLGATRRRLVRQLVTESLLLAVLSGAGGLLIAHWVAPIVMRWSLPAGNRDAVPDFTPDATVFAFSLLLSAVAGLLSGMLPAWHATRVDLTATIKGSLTLFGQRIARTRLLNGLIAAQLAIALVLLVSASLLVRGMLRVSVVDPGFDTERLFSMELEIAMDRSARAGAPALIAEAADRVRHVPGVRAVSIARFAPLGASDATLSWRDAAGRVVLDIGLNRVDAAFFDTLRIPLIRGRTFSPAEIASGAPVAIVNDALARRLWPDRDPIGQVIDRLSKATVIGVTRDAHTANLLAAQPATIYRPLRLAEFATDRTFDEVHAALVVATHGTPRMAIAPAERLVRYLDRRVSIDIETGADGLERWTRPARLASMLSVSLGALALVLTLVGTYGVVSFAVGQRTREIALRQALGATRSDIVRFVLRQARLPIALGLVAGWIGLAFVTPLLRLQLHGISPFDPATFGLVSFAVILAILSSVLLPARLASRLDPMTNLRLD